MEYYVGVDIGSVSINCVVVDETGEVVLETPYLRHFGLFSEEAGKLLESLHDPATWPGADQIRSISFTGVHGQHVAGILSAPSEVETIAQVLGAIKIVPGVKTIISIGGQDAALFQLAHQGTEWRLEAFNMNGPCASGTGSFIDQQAERLSLSMYGQAFQSGQETHQQTLTDFITLGLRSSYPAPVACRCTVFTKSDMIHLQNKGETLPNIIAGLHYGNAANYVSTIVANRNLDDPIIFIGGMASNKLQVQAFKHYFPRIRVPRMHASLGALGVALQARKQGWRNQIDISRLAMENGQSGDFPKGERLELKQTRFNPDNSLPRWGNRSKKLVQAFLGIDIGSTTTKYALIDEDGRILHKSYVPTQGKPIEVTQKLLKTLLAAVGKKIRLLAVATTGSGRNVVGDFLSADLVIDEITAHARGAVAVDPEVDTIFEIGGQDSKYISIENTYPLDFDMNKVCAAGTGSFLHELANKMKINIVGEFQEVALSAENPVHLAERCTVFMESDLVSYSQKGARREDLIGGLCYAIVHNYLNRVVEKRAVGKRVMFLGGPSLNQGVVAAFEKVLGRPIIVPKHREVMGAFGAALSVREMFSREEIPRRTRDLKDLAEIEVGFSETICHADNKCHNECKLKVYSFGKHKSIWGGDCGRYEVSRCEGLQQTDYFLERHRLFTKALEESASSAVDFDRARAGKPIIGVPLALHTLEWGIFWTQLLERLGFAVVLSPRTDSRMALRGMECMTSETCFPIKVFHGHVRYLLDKADFLFLPSVINMPTPIKQETGLFCPLVESSGYMVRSALSIPESRMVTPTIYLREGPISVADQVYRSLPVALRPDRKLVEAASVVAWEKQAKFRETLLARGREILAGTPPAEPVWLVTGRPYNLHDERLNLQLGRHLAKLGIKALPMDFVAVDHMDLSDFPSMYWGLGAKILRAAKLIASTPGMYGVHLTNFSCGADSFLEHFYRHLLKDKPSLILELDEHSAVAGVLTRLEAYRNVVANLQDRAAGGQSCPDGSFEALCQ